jgi:two-component system chemotaxis response regulator CheY
MPSAIIVDDSPIMRAQLRKLLGVAGFTIVAEAGDGIELLGLYEKHLPDLVTLDIVMPNRDGATAAAELLTHHPEAVVVMCTSLNTRDKVEACRRAGVKYYLLKPFNPEHAVAVFRRAVDKKTTILPRVDESPPPPQQAGQRDER